MILGKNDVVHDAWYDYVFDDKRDELVFVEAEESLSFHDITSHLKRMRSEISGLKKNDTDDMKFYAVIIKDEKVSYCETY